MIFAWSDGEGWWVVVVAGVGTAVETLWSAVKSDREVR